MLTTQITAFGRSFTVLAKQDKYGIRAYTFANRTQANNAAAKYASPTTGTDVRQFRGRPFFVVITPLASKETV